MKKILAIALLAFCVAGVVGCSSGSSTAAKPGSSSK
jgi:hypothetical protein